LLELLAGYKNTNSATYLLKITIFIPPPFDVSLWLKRRILSG